MRNIIKVASILSVVLGGVVLAPQADARRQRQVVNGREVVVHSNPIPVALHRALPPHHGRHVTARELQSGRLPQPGAGLMQRGR